VRSYVGRSRRTIPFLLFLFLFDFLTSSFLLPFPVFRVGCFLNVFGKLLAFWFRRLNSRTVVQRSLIAPIRFCLSDGNRLAVIVVDDPINFQISGGIQSRDIRRSTCPVLHSAWTRRLSRRIRLTTHFRLGKPEAWRVLLLINLSSSFAFSNDTRRSRKKESLVDCFDRSRA
jgi:hypothetical protein